MKSENRHTLVCFALKEEASAFEKMVRGRAEVSILLTGIGRKNAERTVREYLQQHDPLRVLTCGFAGGLDPELKIGGVLFLAVDRLLNQELVAAGAKPAKFFCALKVATTAAAKRELRRTTGADAVEMESEVIQQICGGRGIPCATVRVISDTANEDLPLDFNALSKPDLNLNYGKLALAIAKSPEKIPALLRLQKNSKFAAGQLAEVLRKVIESNLPSPGR